MTLAEVIEQMRLAGCSLDQVSAVSSGLERLSKAARQARNHRYYVKSKTFKIIKTSDASESVLNVLKTPPLARVVDNLLTTEISGKEENKKEHGAARRVCESRLKGDFKPTPEMRAYARSKGLTDEQIDAEGEAMRDWSLSSKNGKKLDWEAAWRNWVARKLAPQGNGAGAEPSWRPPQDGTLSPEGYVFDSSKPGGINFLAEPKNRRFLR